MTPFWACWRDMAVKMLCQTYLRHTKDGKRKKLSILNTSAADIKTQLICFMLWNQPRGQYLRLNE